MIRVCHIIDILPVSEIRFHGSLRSPHMLASGYCKDLAVCDDKSSANTTAMQDKNRGQMDMLCSRYQYTPSKQRRRFAPLVTQPGRTTGPDYQRGGTRLQHDCASPAHARSQARWSLEMYLLRRQRRQTQVLKQCRGTEQTDWWERRARAD